MPNQIYSATLRVKVGGQPLPDPVAGVLTLGLVETARGLPGRFELHFADGGRTVVAAGGFKVGARVDLAVTTNEGGSTTLLVGEIATLEAEVGPTGALTIVRGYDISYRLLHHRRVTAYQEMTAADICQKIGGEHGMTVKGSSRVKHAHVLQAGISDWELLQSLAAAEGLELTVSGDTLVLTEPPSATPARGLATSRTDPTVLEYGANLRWLRVAVTASDQATTVQVRGWDPKQERAVVAAAKPTTVSAALAGTTPASLAAAARSGPRLFHAPTLTQQDLATAMAKGIADDLAGAFAELDAAVTGNPALASGTPVSVAGLGAPFDGGYVLTRACHRFDPAGSGYTTEVRVSAASDRTTRGLVASARPGAGAGRATGTGAGEGAGSDTLVYAVVTNVDDPDDLGRVKLTLPTLSDDVETWWAGVVLPGSGRERGFVMMPEVGDVVVAHLPRSPLGAPWVLGGVHSGQSLRPPGLRKRQIKVGTAGWVSRNGMIIQLVEESGKEQIRLSLTQADGQDADALTISKDATKGLAITSRGPVTVTSEKDVTLTAGQSSIVMDANKIELKANQVTVNGQQKIEMTTTDLALKGTANAELSASGVTTVKGSLVKIN